MADWNYPELSSTYSDFLDWLKERDDDLAKMFDGVGTNLPTNSIKWSSDNDRFEKYDGNAWGSLTSKYAINVDSVDGADVNDSGTDTASLWTASKIITELNTKAKTDLTNVDDSTILNKIKNVDGSDSGLDADLLDGVQGSSFVRKDQVNTITGRLAWTTSYAGGWPGGTGDYAAIYMYNGNIVGLNAIVFNDVSTTPTEGIIWPVIDSPSQASDYVSLIGGSDRQPYWYEDASTSTKYKIWTEHNDGDDSGLNADLLDGYHASAFSKTQTMSIINASDAGYYTIAKVTFTDDSQTTGVNFVGTVMPVGYAELDGSNTVVMPISVSTYIYRIANQATSLSYSKASTFSLFGLSNDFALKPTYNLYYISDATNSHIMELVIYVPKAGKYTVDGSLYIASGKDYTSLEFYPIAITPSSPSSTIEYAPAQTWTSDSDGTGSGLDADLLDGKQSDDFVQTYENSVDGISKILNVVKLSEDDYNNLSTKDSNTLYVIV